MLNENALRSSVDGESEALMNEIIHEDFKDTTVLAVAHRLEGMEAFDRVVLMDEGRVVESGRPKDLLEMPSGKLRAMWEQSRETHFRNEV